MSQVILFAHWWEEMSDPDSWCRFFFKFVESWPIVPVKTLIFTQIMFNKK